MNDKFKKYPNQIERKGFVLKKSTNEFLIHLEPKSQELGIRNFFDEKKELIELISKADDKKSIMIREFNAFQRYT